MKQIAKSRVPRSAPGLDLHPHTKRAIFGVGLVTIGILIFLSFFTKAGVVGGLVEQYSFRIFGVGRYVLPLFLFIAAGIFFISERRYVYRSTITGGMLLFFSLLGIFEAAAKERHWGGGVGKLVFAPLKYLVGDAGALLILLGMTFVALLILFNIPLGKRKKEAIPSALIIPSKEKRGSRFHIPQFLKKITFGRPSGFKVQQLKGLNDEREETAAAEDFSSKMGELKEEGIVAAKAKSPFRYRRPPLELFEPDTGEPTSGDIKANASIIKRTLQNFGIEVDMGEVNIGPTVTQYTLKPAQGVKLSRITVLAPDLSLALAAHPLRIEAPIPGKSLVGIEIPNKTVQLVRLRGLLEHSGFTASGSNLVFALGRDVAGNPVFADLAKMPHLLIAGSTGSGKTIALNTIISSLIERNSPKLLRFILIDPKRVEFPVYDGLPHLLTPVITNVSRTVNVLRWTVIEMERRFEVLSQAKARDIRSYNEQILRKKDREGNELMPFLIVIIDELADLMAARGREVEASIVRLAQMARAVGIHLVVATQRPSVEVITGLIKANITSRVAFQVASQVDSRTIIDMAGAEKLLGNGDMLFISAETAKPRRIQGAFVSDKEIRRITDFIRENAGEAKYETEVEGRASSTADKGMPSGEIIDNFDEYGGSDPLLPEAKQEIIRARKASASFLQRRLRIGYARAARILDLLEEEGVVGPGEGAKPREIYMRGEEEKEDIEEG